MKWNIGNKIGGLVVIAIIAFITFGIISYMMINTLNDSINWSTHTYKVLNLNGTLFSHLQDAETGQRGYIITGQEKYLEPYNTSKDIYNVLDEVKESTKDNPAQQKRLEKLKIIIDEKYDELQKNLDLRRDSGFAIAMKAMKEDKGKQIMGNFRAVIQEIEDEEYNLLAIRESKMKSDSKRTKNIIVFGSLFAIILLTIIGIFIGRNISIPLSQVTEVADRIAKGDLKIDVNSMDRDDEVGKLNNAFYLMVSKLRKSMEEIAGGVTLLGSSASEILAATTQVAASASESASAISETSTTVEEVRQAAQLSSQKASNVSDNAQQVAQVTRDGERAVDDTVNGMHEIQKQMDSVANTIVRLSEQSQQIGGIIAAVTDVAEQSNLLAVNASIEAAKAGEHGKGFAVVAQEIKSLAQQSKQSTIQVRNILNDIQKATSAAVMATEQTGKAVENGVKQSNLAGEAIKKLSESTEKSVEAALQIAASSNQQVAGMDQIGLAMQNIEQAGAENAASMIQAEKSAKDLNELGQKLDELVKQYKL